MFDDAYGDDSGESTVGDAISLFAVLALIFAALQVVLVYLAITTGRHTAGVAASAESAYGAEAGAGETAAEDFLDQTGQFLSGAEVEVDRDGEQATATVTGEAIIVFDFPVSYDIQRTATGQLEQWVPFEGG